MKPYQSFISEKAVRFEPKGFEVTIDAEKFGKLHQYQPAIVQWALKLGCAAIFAHFGMGKTRMQLEWANEVAKHTDGKVLILAPLAVAHQTIAEGQKFGIVAQYVRSQAEADAAAVQILVTNYERLKDFDGDWQGVVLDESAILKKHTGKTKQMLCSKFKAVPYRLCLSALPAPNDWLELGAHSEFLGIMDSHTMISRWFRNDTMQAGKYVLRAHARSHFWDWLASWAICITRPSDLGFSDEGWDLPANRVIERCVEVDHTKSWNEADRNGQLSLLSMPSNSATTIHKEQRKNVDELAVVVADILASIPDTEPVPVWVFTDYEADAILGTAKHMDLVNLSGKDSPDSKQKKLTQFADGDIKRLITKPEIAGLGLNWQHCCHQIFVMGSSYSFEQYFQAFYRLVRFGQKREVTTYLVYAETAGNVRSAIHRKQMQFEQMTTELRAAVRRSQFKAHRLNALDDYSPTEQILIPNWLKSKASCCLMIQGG